MNADAAETVTLKTVINFLFGTANMRPLRRKAFFKAAMSIFLIRGPITWALSYFILKTDKYIESISLFSLIVIFVICVIVACVFLIPYFTVLYQRLLAINFPFPRLLTWSLAICLVLYCAIFVSEYTWRQDLIFIAIYLIVYLSLLPWPERSPLHQHSHRNVDSL